MNYDIQTYTMMELLQILQLNESSSLETVRTTIDFFHSKARDNGDAKLMSFLSQAKDILTRFLLDLREDPSLSYDTTVKSYLKQADPNTYDDEPIHKQDTTQLDQLQPGKIYFNANGDPVYNPFPMKKNSTNMFNISRVVNTYVFDTKYRHDYFNTISTDATFILPSEIKNVTSMSLAACQFPNVIYAFNTINGTNMIYIEEDITGDSAIVSIPEGNYEFDSFCNVLQDAINEQVCNLPISSTQENYRFFVTPNFNNYKLTISNNFHSFKMNILKKTEQPVPCGEAPYRRTSVLNYLTDTECVVPGDLFKTMGYIIGFRNQKYEGKRSYQTESTFNNYYSTYVYFSLDDFVTGSQLNTTRAVYTDSISRGNLLALIPLRGQNFSITFDNNSNFIYKTRLYVSPVTIRRIKIQILDQEGQLVNVHNRDFAFSLQFETIYDPTV